MATAGEGKSSAGPAGMASLAGLGLLQQLGFGSRLGLTAQIKRRMRV